MTGAFSPAGDLGELRPSGDQVRLAAFALDPPAPVVTSLRGVLADDERARADRFHFDRHRRRFIVGRAVLRHLLGAALGRRPERVAFRYGPHGKPAIDGADLPFNLSNSSELALIAWGGSVELGVDVERVRPMSDADAIARRFFSAAEAERFGRLPNHDRDHGFFRCWTRKEAYIKAIGDGLTMPLDRFRVSFDRGEPCRFLAIGDDDDEADAWHLRHLDPAPGYIGALALRAPAVEVRAHTLVPALLASLVHPPTGR